jgi:hypothetical protein
MIDQNPNLRDVKLNLLYVILSARMYA